MSTTILNQRVKVGELDIFYRETGDKGKPSILLLHGFPSSSVMFKSLMVALAGNFHLIAPDYPGFGFSDFPAAGKFRYTFSNIARVIEEFTEVIKLDRFYVYLHDYGSSIGLRLCLNHPERILGLIVQNGNAYEEGLGPQWDQTREFWAHPTEEKKQKVLSFLSEEGTRMQYTAGVPEALLQRISPEQWLLDWTLMSRPGNIEMQAQLNWDYQHNIPMFPEFQAYFRQHQPRALILWGKYDVFFSMEEAYCYQRDLKNVELHLLEGAHMALETNFDEVVTAIKQFIRPEHSVQSATGS